jgi:hypothetical protein
MRKSNRATYLNSAGLLVFLLITAATANAQTIVLQRETVQHSKQDHGPNLKKFGQVFFTVGMIASPDFPGAKIVYGTSAELGFGIRKKHKVGSVYSFGWLMGYEYTDFKLKQYSGKLISSPQQYDEQRIDINYVYLGLFNRFNFDPSRGNTLGTFFEFGARGKYAFSVSEIQKYKVATGNAQTSISGLKYFKDRQADAYVLIGHGHFSLWASMRLTELLEPSYNYPKLPNITAGLEIGF